MRAADKVARFSNSDFLLCVTVVNDSEDGSSCSSSSSRSSVCFGTSDSSSFISAAVAAAARLFAAVFATLCGTSLLMLSFFVLSVWR